MNNKMKAVSGVMVMAVLIGGGAAVTQEQVSQTTDITQNLTHELRSTVMGECPFVETPIFDTVAYVLINLNGCNTDLTSLIDIDGDGIIRDIHAESRYGMSQMTGCVDPDEVNYQAGITTFVTGSNPPAFATEIILDLTPGIMQYEGGPTDPTDLRYGFSTLGVLDVTNDGKPDVIVHGQWADCGTNNWQSGYFYIENISTPTVACTSDATGDGVVNVNDLLAMIADWGACP